MSSIISLIILVYVIIIVLCTLYYLLIKFRALIIGGIIIYGLACLLPKCNHFWGNVVLGTIVLVAFLSLGALLGDGVGGSGGGGRDGDYSLSSNSTSTSKDEIRREQERATEEMKRKSIGSAVQSGPWVRVYNLNGNFIFSKPGELYGYTSSTVSIRDDKFVRVYDVHGSQISGHFLD